MKKILVVCAAAMLCCSLAYAQEADEPGTGAELTIVPRVDFGLPLSLGNSSFYSFFDGNLTENLSFSISNHWASFALTDKKFDSEAITDLYKYTWRSDWTNWCDWAYFDYNVGNFDIMLGKFTMAVGGMEFDFNDVECHTPLMSSLWSEFSPYQWGGCFGWTDSSENTTLSLEMVTSPFGERPFGSGLFSYGLKWTGEYGPLNNIWSVSHMDTGDGYFTLVSLGQSLAICDDLSVTVDWSNAICDPTDWLVYGNSAYASLDWQPCDKWEFLVKGGFESAKDYDGGSSIGCAAHWFPLESGNLRVHGNFGYRDFGAVSDYYATIGVLYQLNFHIGK